MLAQLGFGQASLLVTPIRMALVAATIADGGRTPRPYLVRSIAGSETSLATSPEQLAAPLGSEAAGEVRDLMIAVVQHGTGTVAALPGVTVAGKTGTATNGGIGVEPNSWFVGFGPANHPKYVVLCVIDEGGYGADAAAPVVARTFNYLVAHPIGPVRFKRQLTIPTTTTTKPHSTTTTTPTTTTPTTTTTTHN